jgi:hypothetical protein
MHSRGEPACICLYVSFLDQNAVPRCCFCLFLSHTSHIALLTYPFSQTCDQIQLSHNDAHRALTSGTRPGRRACPHTPYAIRLKPMGDAMCSQCLIREVALKQSFSNSRHCACPLRRCPNCRGVLAILRSILSIMGKSITELSGPVQIKRREPQHLINLSNHV